MLVAEVQPKPFSWHWFFTFAAIAGIATVLLPVLVNMVAIKPIESPNQPALFESTPIAEATTRPKGKVTKLQKVVDNFVATQSATWGIYVIDLKTGQTATHLPNKQFISASLYKLYVAEGILRRVDSGKLKLTSKQDICLGAMITVSDNTCGRSLGTTLGWGYYNPELAKLGYTGTQLNRSNILTTPADVAKLYKALYNRTHLKKTTNQKLLALLKSQRVNNRLPLGLPRGTVIAHKTGDLYGYMHDAGIVYTPGGNYIVVGMSGPWAKPANSFAAFQSLSSRLYNHFN